MATNHSQWWRNDGDGEWNEEIDALSFVAKHASIFESQDSVGPIFRRQDLPTLRVMATGTRKPAEIGY